MDAETLAKQLEMEAMADMFTKMTDSCHNKCISKFYDRKIIIVILLSNRKMANRKLSASANSQSESFFEKVESFFEIVESFFEKVESFFEKIESFFEILESFFEIFGSFFEILESFFEKVETFF